MNDDNAEQVASPCVGICSPDENDICMGCLRTMQEVTLWWEMDNAGKRELLKVLSQRIKK
jgi:predicted Fe-S protein YdhL (DUF1289 family)